MGVYDQLSSQMQSQISSISNGVSSAIPSDGVGSGLSLDQLKSIKASAIASGQDPAAAVSSAISGAGVSLPGVPSSAAIAASASALSAFKLPSIARIDLQQLASEKIKPETLSDVSAAADSASATADSVKTKLAKLQSAMSSNPLTAGLSAGLPSLPSNPLSSASIVSAAGSAAEVSATDLSSKLAKIQAVSGNNPLVAASASTLSAASSLTGSLSSSAVSAFNSASAAAAGAANKLVSGLASGAPNISALASSAGSAFTAKADAFAAVSASAAALGKVLPNVKSLAINPDTIIARAQAAGLPLPSGGLLALKDAAAKVQLTPEQKQQLIADAKDKGISPAVALANASLNGVAAQLALPSTFKPPAFPSVLPKLPSLDTSSIPSAFPTGVLGAASSLTNAAQSATSALTGISSLAPGLSATAGQAVNGVSSQLIPSPAYAVDILAAGSKTIGGQTAQILADGYGVVGIKSVG